MKGVYLTMDGVFFRITTGEFWYLNKFLSSVKSTIPKNYEFPIAQSFQSCDRSDVLRALGFQFAFQDPSRLPVYRFDGIPNEPNVQFVVDKSVDATHGQWTVSMTTENQVYLRWKGPQNAGVDETILPHLEDTFLSAQEAREIADKALQTTKNLKKVLQKVCEAAEAGNYELTLTENPGDAICQRLNSLGFKTTNMDVFCILWNK